MPSQGGLEADLVSTARVELDLDLGVGLEVPQGAHVAEGLSGARRFGVDRFEDAAALVPASGVAPRDQLG
ncbi:MAG: hypothetical protein EA397_07195 [Deltaproteobacteria bacterium]|nr:MAG: hypothetical protein EA397_07195 [Deltaproteobacteria bacterium]